MPKGRTKADQTTPNRVSLRTVVWACTVVAIGTAIISASIVLAIDRPQRAPLGAWISDFAKSPGLGGISALAAASLALWGIFAQTNVAKRSLNHQRQVDKNSAWWERFEWTSSRAVPRSKDETPLPYEAVLSTLTSLAETATDDVQRRAVGAITQIAAEEESGGKSADTVRLNTLPTELTARIEALQKYSQAAGDSPARSTAIDAQLYEFQVTEALKRILDPDSVRTGDVYPNTVTSGRIAPDALVVHNGKRIVVEIKNYKKPWFNNRNTVLQVRNLIEATNAHAGIVVTPTEIPAVSQFKSLGIITAKWSSTEDDSTLRTALDSATA